MYDSKGGLTAWIWRCFRKESGPNGLVTVTPKKFKFLQGGLVTGAGAMEGVDCVRCTSMI